MRTRFLPGICAALALAAAALAQDGPKPLKVLLITGGCCHDYAQQKDILKAGLEARANVVIDQIHTDDKSTAPALPIYGNPHYGDGYDVIIHDECAAAVSDPAIIDGVLQPHRNGVAGVNLHCAMHCYRFGDYKSPVTPGADNARWFEYLGLQSTGHGSQEPIAITFTDRNSPIAKRLTDWTTIKEELYNNVQILTGQGIASGKQNQPVKTKGADGKALVTGAQEVESVIAWTNEYGPRKTRVFSTTIGHHNETVADARYLDLVTRGLLWASGHLDANGTPAQGYGK